MAETMAVKKMVRIVREPSIPFLQSLDARRLAPQLPSCLRAVPACLCKSDGASVSAMKRLTLALLALSAAVIPATRRRHAAARPATVRSSSPAAATTLSRRLDSSGDLVPSAAPAARRRRLTTANTDHHRHATWSPDRTKIAYARSTRPTAASPDRGTSTSRTSRTAAAPVLLANGHDEPTVRRWSPDGTRIAYQEWDGAADWTIKTKPANGTSHRRRPTTPHRRPPRTTRSSTAELVAGLADDLLPRKFIGAARLRHLHGARRRIDPAAPDSSRARRRLSSRRYRPTATSSALHARFWAERPRRSTWSDSRWPAGRPLPVDHRLTNTSAPGRPTARRSPTCRAASAWRLDGDEELRRHRVGRSPRPRNAASTATPSGRRTHRPPATTPRSRSPVNGFVTIPLNCSDEPDPPSYFDNGVQSVEIADATRSTASSARSSTTSP